MLKSNSIQFTYDGEKKFKFPDLNINSGESLLVLGESGVGKTTFIQILAGLLKPSSGSLESNSINYSSLSSKKMDEFRGKNIGMIFQSPHFVRNISVIENLLLSLHLSNQKLDKEYAENILSQIGLAEKMNRLPDELSQGEQQRAAIALAVIKNPDLILADEPTSSLDDTNCQKIISLLKEQSASKNAAKLIVDSI